MMTPATAADRRPSILASCPLPPRVASRLQGFAALTCLDGEYDCARLVARCAGHDALICSLRNRIDADFIARLPPSLRLVATYSVGLDHIDRGTLAARGIRVINTPDVLTEATADIAWLLLLGAARRGWEAQSMLREGRWRGWEPTQLVGADLFGRTLGVLGFGRIGRATARRAAGFGMKVRTFVRAGSAAGAIPDEVVLCASMDEVLASSDFVSLHLPLTAETRLWLDAGRIAAMKRGAFVINTARGGLIDEAALVQALHSGHLGGAGLDVFEGEPAISPALLGAPNTCLLPHIGSATTFAREGMGMSLAADLEAFFAGRQMSCEVGPG